MNRWSDILACLTVGQNCVLVSITGVRGSAPREVGAAMILAANREQCGSIGGGALEWRASKTAHDLLGKHREHFLLQEEIILGPELEQCCGGVVQLSYEVFTQADKQLVTGRVRQQAQPEPQNLAIFGAGHVGQALIKLLATQDFSVTLIDSRPNMLPEMPPENVRAKYHNDPPALVKALPDNTFVLIMTHCHKLDYDLTAAALCHPDISFIGLIGSATKRARFVRRLSLAGLSLERIARLTCPIGIRGIASKTPAAIAASVLAQLLIETELVEKAKNTVQLSQNRA